MIILHTLSYIYLYHPLCGKSERDASAHVRRQLRVVTPPMPLSGPGVSLQTSSPWRQHGPQVCVVRLPNPKCSALVSALQFRMSVAASSSWSQLVLWAIPSRATWFGWQTWVWACRQVSPEGFARQWRYLSSNSARLLFDFGRVFDIVSFTLSARRGLRCIKVCAQSSIGQLRYVPAVSSDRSLFVLGESWK